MKLKLSFVALFSLVTVVESTARADDDVQQVPPVSAASAEPPTKATEPAPQAPPDHVFALTLTPAYLLLPGVRVTGEGRVARRLGLAVALGGASYPVFGLFRGDDRILSLDATAMVNGYAIGHFDHGLFFGGGMTLSGAVGTVRHDGSGRALDPVDVSGVGLMAFAHVGYKYTAPVGFTVSVRLGAGFGLAQASGEQRFVGADGAARAITASASLHAFLPVGDIAIGWAF